MRWLVCLVAVLGCKSRDHAAPPAPSPTTIAAPADAAAPRVAIDAQPAPPPVAYIGSENCADCHDKEYKAWQKSWHARALAVAEPKSIVGNFDDAHFAGTSSEAWMTREGQARRCARTVPTATLADFPVDYVIGGKRMQDAVTVFPDGRWQVLPVYFHVADAQWVDYTETKQGPLTPDHPFYWTNARRMANHECLDCHTTALRVDYERDRAASGRPRSSTATSRARTAMAPAASTPTRRRRPTSSIPALGRASA